MRNLTRNGAVVLAGILLLAPAARADSDGHVLFVIGQKSLEDEDWDPLDSQVELGALMSFGQVGWPVHIAVDVLGSSDEETFEDPLVGEIDATGSTFEIGVGVRKIWGKEKTHGYLGGGVAIVGAEVELDSFVGDANADDEALGPWVGGGIFWRLGSRFEIGFDIRWSGADVDLDFGGALPTAEDVDAGGLHTSLLLGFGW